jgi:site-specific recombinase XerD
MSLITVENGRKIYYDHRKKTSVRLCFPLLGPALEILERYNGLPLSLTTKNKTSGKIISNAKYNKFLKEISEPAGLSQSLTTHWARHTGATMLLNAGVAPEVIAVVGGWANTKVLMKIYAKMQEKTVIKAVNDVEQQIV